MNGRSQSSAPIACNQETALDASLPLSASDLHERYLGLVFRYVSRRLPHRAEAEDVTAEVFVAAFDMLPRFRGQCAPHLWLLGIARRKATDALRRRSRRKETLASEMKTPNDGADALLERFTSQTAGPEQAVQQAEARRRIRELVESLKPDQREALLLHYVEDLSLNDLGVVMRRSPQAVNSLLQRARANLFRAGRDYFLDEDGDAR